VIGQNNTDLELTSLSHSLRECLALALCIVLAAISITPVVAIHDVPYQLSGAISAKPYSSSYTSLCSLCITRFNELSEPVFKCRQIWPRLR
jgi:hypothetical protein